MVQVLKFVTEAGEVEIIRAGSAQDKSNLKKIYSGVNMLSKSIVDLNLRQIDMDKEI